MMEECLKKGGGNTKESINSSRVVLRRMVIPYEGQSFSALRRQCQQAGRLFEDPLFPAADQSLFYQNNRIGRVTWKRPKVSRNTCGHLQHYTAL